MSFEDDSDLGYARAGTAVQRVWHQANRLGVSVHPVAPITTYVRRVDELSARFTGADLEEARSQHEQLRDLLELGPRTLALPLRLSLVDGPPAPRSGRRPVHPELAGNRPSSPGGSARPKARLQPRQRRTDLSPNQGIPHPIRSESPSR